MIYQAKKFLWALPFVAFAGGYFAAAVLFGAKSVSVPPVVGMNAAQAIKTLSLVQLNMRLMGEREDANLPNGTVVTQEPAPGAKLKQNRAVFVAISHKPGIKTMPALQGMTSQQAQAALVSLAAQPNIVPIVSNLPQGTVIAQSPAAGNAVRGHVVVYVAAPHDQKYLFPDLRGHTLGQVTEFLALHHLKPGNVQALGWSQVCAPTQPVVEQRPLPGTLVSLENVPSIQLLVN